MTCPHTKRKTTTAWQAYEPRLAGIVQAKLIREERCTDCGDVRVSSSEGIRATRDRAAKLATRLDPLRHRAEERQLLRDLLESARVDEDEYTASAGAWRLRLERALGGATLESLLSQLMADGLVTLQRSRTARQYDKVTGVSWPAAQYAQLCAELGVGAPSEVDVEAELEAAIRDLGARESLGALAAFWSDQAEQLHGGNALILDPSGEQLLTSRAPRYPRIIRATIKIAQGHLAGRVRLFDELGIEVTGNTKDLRQDRPILRAICGGSLAGYGVIEPTQLIEIAGPARFRGPGFDLASQSHAFGLSAELVSAADIVTTSTKLVIVENPTSFYYSLRTRAFGDAVCLLADGRLSGPQKTLISRLVEAGVPEVVAWCDIDPAGIMIADDIRRAAHGAKFTPFLLDIKTFEQAPARRKIVGQNLRFVKTLAGQEAWYTSLAQLLEKSGEWVEQETLHGFQP